jgi:hypothetical protein
MDEESKVRLGRGVKASGQRQNVRGAGARMCHGPSGGALIKRLCLVYLCEGAPGIEPEAAIERIAACQCPQSGHTYLNTQIEKHISLKPSSKCRGVYKRSLMHVHCSKRQ